MTKYLILAILILGGLLYWQINRNGTLVSEANLLKKQAKETQATIDDLAIRLSAANETSRRALETHQQRVRNPGVAVQTLEELLQEKSK